MSDIELVPAYHSRDGYADHLYSTCPLAQQGGPVRELATGVDPDDPYGLCGWCLRVWKARNR